MAGGDGQSLVLTKHVVYCLDSLAQKHEVPHGGNGSDAELDFITHVKTNHATHKSILAYVLLPRRDADGVV